jgi:hypothetical protein
MLTEFWTTPNWEYRVALQVYDFSSVLRLTQPRSTHPSLSLTLRLNQTSSLSQLAVMAHTLSHLWLCHKKHTIIKLANSMRTSKQPQHDSGRGFTPPPQSTNSCSSWHHTISINLRSLTFNRASPQTYVDALIVYFIDSASTYRQS